MNVTFTKYLLYFEAFVIFLTKFIVLDNYINYSDVTIYPVQNGFRTLSEEFKQTSVHIDINVTCYH